MLTRAYSSSSEWWPAPAVNSLRRHRASSVEAEPAQPTLGKSRCRSVAPVDEPFSASTPNRHRAKSYQIGNGPGMVGRTVYPALGCISNCPAKLETLSFSRHTAVPWQPIIAGHLSELAHFVTPARTQLVPAIGALLQGASRAMKLSRTCEAVETLFFALIHNTFHQGVFEQLSRTKINLSCPLHPQRRPARHFIRRRS